MPLKSRLMLSLLVVVSTAPTVAQTPAPTSPLAAAATRALANLPAGGIVTAELKEGTVTYAVAGTPLARTDVPPEKIIFEIGSISKVFTSLLLAQAVTEGKAALTDPIASYLPADLKLPPATAAITLEQLATHTSGLPRLPDNLTPAVPQDPYADYTVERLYAFLSRHQPAANAPQPFAYSNLGAGLLGHVLERIYAKPYAELLAEKITTPLGLSDTVIGLNAEQTARFAKPHSGSLEVLPWRFAALAGAGALHSTAADLTKFAQALLSDTPTPVSAAWALARPPRAKMNGADSIGLAIMSAQIGGVQIFNHGGGTGGFRSFLELTPGRKHAVIVLLNNDNLEPATLAATTRIMPAAPSPAATAAREEVPLAAGQLAEYPGIYAIDAHGKFTVVADDSGHLRIRLSGQTFLRVFYAGQDRFFAKAVAAEFQFNRDAGGKLTGLTLLQNGREIPAQRSDASAPTVIFLSPEKLAEYAGQYELAPGMRFEVSARAGHVLVKLTGQPAFPVFCDRADHFVYEVVEAALTFERDAGGAITQLVLHQNGSDRPARRLP